MILPRVTWADRAHTQDSPVLVTMPTIERTRRQKDQTSPKSLQRFSFAKLTRPSNFHCVPGFLCNVHDKKHLCSTKENGRMVFQFIKRSFYLQVGVFQIGTGCQNSKVPKGYKHNQFTPFPTISCKRSPGSAPFHHLASKVIGSEKSWNKDYIIRVN